MIMNTYIRIKQNKEEQQNCNIQHKLAYRVIEQVIHQINR